MAAPMTQQDIRNHYEGEWGRMAGQAAGAGELGYSSPIEDAIVYPLYRQLVSDLKIRVNGGAVLDIGSGCGRWIRFFLGQFQPGQLVGVDYTQQSVNLLAKFFASTASTQVEFRLADITDPGLDLGQQFDLVNIANVLFHIPEDELYGNALRNLAKLVRPGGAIITTEYLPRCGIRTQWMKVRSRYEFESLVDAAGLRIVNIRAFGFFVNDPMGIDGPDEGIRRYFHQARARLQQLISAISDPRGRDFVFQTMMELERAALEFCRERIPDIDMPSQKLVVLAPKG